MNELDLSEILQSSTASLVQQKLEPSEKLLWCGRPDPWMQISMQIWPLIAGIAFMGWFFLEFHQALPHFLRLENIFSAYFLICAFFFVCCSFPIMLAVVRALQAQSEIYAITDRRVLFLDSGWFFPNVRSYALDSIISSSMKRYDDTFGEVIWTIRGRRAPNGVPTGRNFPVTFLGVRNPELVRAIGSSLLRLPGDAGKGLSAGADFPSSN